MLDVKYKSGSYAMPGQQVVSKPGLSELDKALAQIPDKLQKNIIRAALAAGSKVIAEEAKRIVRNEAYREGRLYDSIRVSSYAKYRKMGGRPAAIVKAGRRVTGSQVGGKRDAWYAHIVEWGAKPHVIRAKSSKGLRIGDRRLLQVNHPGVQGIRFMTRAADTQTLAAVNAYAEKMRERLQKAGINVPAPVEAEEMIDEG